MSDDGNDLNSIDTVIVSPKMLSVAKAKRKGLRSTVTRELKTANDRFNPVDDTNRLGAEAHVAKLRKLTTDLADAQNQVLVHADLSDKELNDEVSRHLDYENLLSDAIYRLEAEIRDVQHQRQQKPVTTVAPEAQQQQSDNMSKVKTPKLELTKFNGDPLHWEEFWDDFSCSVDQRTNLSTIDKFKLLKQSLEGDALSLADGYFLTQRNYQEVKDALQDRFGDPQVAIFAHFEALLELPPANHEVDQLVRIRDKCEAHIRSLAALGLSEDTFGLVFAPILLSKLPRFVKMEMHRRNGSQRWTLAALREHLKEEIRVRTKSDRSFGSSPEAGPSSTGGSKSGKGGKKQPPTSSTLLNQGGKKGKGGQGSKPPPPKSTKPPSCVFCKGEHFNGDCTKYPTVESRLPLIKGKCFNCFSDSHMKNECKSKKNCYHCHKPGHNSSLCYEKYGKPKPADTTAIVSTGGLNPEASEFWPQSTLAAPATPRQQPGRSGTAILESARVEVSGQKGSAKARLVFDNASSLSFIRSDFSNRVGAKTVGRDRTMLGRFGDQDRDEKSFALVQVRLRLRDGSDIQINLRKVPAVSAPLRLVPIPFENLNPMIELNDLAEVITQPTEEEIDILLGLDYYYQIVGPEVSRYNNGIVLKQSAIGKIVTGYLHNFSDSDSVSFGHQMVTTTASPNERDLSNLERFLGIEEVGMVDRNERSDDDIALQLFNDSVQFENGRYHVRWPFKTDPPELPINYDVAFRRLVSVCNKLQKTSDLLTTYHDIFMDQLKKGVIEEAPEDPEGPVHYLPHHAVVIPTRETTKVRVVFDASSKPSDRFQSLNESMYRGPVFLNNLCGLLLRFRFHKYAVTSDVEKAFLQINLQRDHRDCTRFIWLRDPLKPPSPDNLIVFRYARVLFGATASPFLLAATIIHHLKMTDTDVSRAIIDCTYMDNIIGGHESTVELLNYYKEAKPLFEQMSMNLHQWYSNNAEFLQSIPTGERGTRDTPSVLGLKWNLGQDSLACSVGTSSIPKPTKRSVLQCIASVYDPCGWFSAVTVTGKILLQDMWKQNLDWDAALPDDLAKVWDKVSQSLGQISTHHIPRLLSWASVDRSTGVFELHVFCDASAKAYSAVVFLRLVTEDRAFCDLLFGKSRVAPVKPLTIPKLELTAAKVGSELIQFVEEQIQLPIKEKFLWSDSQCTLSWIESPRVSTTFVVNRVRAIRKVPGLDFRYVPSEENPADVGSRGADFNTLSHHELWWKGPAWLRGPKDSWPQRQSADSKEPFPEEPDIQMVVQSHTIDPDPVFDIERYSSLSKLLRVTCFVRRACQRFKKMPTPTGNLSVQELRDTLNFWEHRIQNQHFSSIIDGKPTGSLKNLSHQLGLFVDKTGYIRCRGRFLNAIDLTDESKCPIFLPKEIWFTKLVIKDCHEKVLHFGPKHTLAKFHERYWVSQGRSTIKGVLLKCQVCRIHKGGPFKSPDPGPLPSFRVSENRPFASTGLDYLGPLYVRNGAQTSKVWIALFTCALTRAIHLEVVQSLSASDFLMSLRRFVAIHGKPHLIVSDNATQFKAADQVLKKDVKRIAENADFVDQLTTMGITWKFIPEKAPWMGGFYERLVAIVKEALKKSLGKWSVTSVELHTLCYEVSFVVNSRPLIYSEDDPASKVLTPLDLMFRSTDSFPDGSGEAIFSENLSKADELLSHWKAGQNLLRQFWDSWKADYLLSLRQFHRMPKDRGASEIPVAENTVVLIKDNLPRGQWRVGRIAKLRKSQDGVVRAAEVKLASGSTLVRPIKVLYPIEGGLGKSDSPPSAGSPPGSPQPAHATDAHQQRATRRAALKARAATKQMLSSA